MTLQTLSLAITNTNAATFKAWGQAISTALSATACLQRTADTGQIDWTTNPAVPGTNAAAGYEMYRFKDTQQSAAPMFLKFEYGTGASATTANMWLTVGTGSDGAGTITSTVFPGIPAANQGIARTATWFSPGNTATANTYLNSDANGFALFLAPAFVATQSSGSLLLVERARAFDGTATTDGYTFLYAFSSGSSSSCQQQPISYLANTFSPASQTIRAWQSGSNLAGGATLNLNGVLYAQPVFTGFNLKLGGPSQLIMAITPTDLGGGATISFAHYGVSHTWMSAGYGATSGSLNWNQWPGSCGSFLYRMT